MVLLRGLTAAIASLVALTVYAQDAPSNQTVATPASSACATIRLVLGAAIVEYAGSEYDATVNNPWNLFNSVDRPTCIVYPRIALHVQCAMKNIYHFQSQYAIQAGSHSGMIGWNTVMNGVLISFAHMNSTTYNSTTDTVTVLPGVHWGDAMDAVESFGVSVIGGRASDVGTGLLLGGGISFISPLYGWSADNIKEMDVVLVTGQLVTVTATNQYADLFRALKGGANRFGIVTRYELYAAHTGTKEQKNWYGGFVVYPASAAAAVSNASARYIREVTDPKAGLEVVLTASGANTAYMFYEGDSLPASIFGDFLSIPSTSQTLSPLSYYDMANLIPGNERGNGQEFGASAWIGDETVFLNGYNHFANFSQTFQTEISSALLIISPVPRSQWAATKSGPNAIGSDPGVNYAAIDFYTIYPAGETVRPADVQAGLQLLLSQTPRSAGLPLYINECDASQNVYATYPGFSTLQTTYAKYDPSRFIIKHMAGPVGL